MVRAMESRVESLGLGTMGYVSLDITALSQYSGQGKCGDVMLCDTAGRYEKELKNLARRINYFYDLQLDATRNL